MGGNDALPSKVNPLVLEAMAEPRVLPRAGAAVDE